MESEKVVERHNCLQYQGVIIKRDYFHKGVDCCEKASHLLLWVFGLFCSIFFTPIAIYGLLKWSIGISCQEKANETNKIIESPQVESTTKNNVINEEVTARAENQFQVQDSIKSSSRLDVVESETESSKQENSTCYDTVMQIYYGPRSEIVYYKCTICSKMCAKYLPFNFYLCVIVFKSGLGVLLGIVWLIIRLQIN